jgi:alpha-glucosidase
MTNADRWWDDAAIYQVYLRSFADSDGDGIGDLRGLAARLEHIADLGVDGIWLNPCYTSPQRDHGYDISDYTSIDPTNGTLADFDALVAQAHDLGLKVLLDMVANHCSSDHPWFRAALAGPPGSAERERFLFRDGQGSEGASPPNDWESVFGGPAWTRVTTSDGSPGQWYLHLFDPTQPDFNWRSTEVAEMFVDVLRFWFNRGIDGFRLDVAHGLVKHPDLLDWPAGEDGVVTYNAHMWNQPEVHQIYRQWRTLADSYHGVRDVMLIGEVWVPDPSHLAQYVSPDELHQAFYFGLLGRPWQMPAYREAIARGLETCGPMPTWTLANHDVPRAVTRLGTSPIDSPDTGSDLIAAARLRGAVDLVEGDRRARAALLLVLALPGSVYLYQGEELGLPEVLELPDGARLDPIWFRSGGTEVGRDGCRVPLPWEAEQETFGFSPDNAPLPPWLPQPPWFAGYAVDTQQTDEDSFLTLNRQALNLRRPLWAQPRSPLTWLETGNAGVLAFARGAAVCVTNFSTRPYNLPSQWGTVSLSSVAMEATALPMSSTAWLA